MRFFVAHCNNTWKSLQFSAVFLVMKAMLRQTPVLSLSLRPPQLSAVDFNVHDCCPYYFDPCFGFASLPSILFSCQLPQLNNPATVIRRVWFNRIQQDRLHLHRSHGRLRYKPVCLLLTMKMVQNVQ